MTARGSSPPTGGPPPFETQEEQPAKIFSDLSTLFLSERYSDVTIISRGRMFPAHRAIISSQCPLYDAAIRYAPMGLHTPVLTLPESDDPDVVLRLLQFLYTGNYDDEVLHPELLKGPSKFAMMTQAEVAQELQKPFGVVVADDDKSEYSEDGDYDPEDTSDSMDVENDCCEESDEGGDGDGDGDVSEDGDKTPPHKWGLSNGEPPYEFGYSEFDGPDEMRWDGRRHYREFPINGVDRYLVKDLHGKRRDLVLHARLHIMANRCELPGLALLARGRFYRAAELAGECFPDVVGEIYDAPASESGALRAIAGRIIGNSFTDDAFRERLAAVMVSHADLAVDVMNVIAKKARDRKW